MYSASDISGAIGVGILAVALLILLFKHRNAGRAGIFYIASVFVLTVVEGYNTYMRAVYPDYNPGTVYIIGLEFLVFALLLLYFHNILVIQLFRNISTGILVVFFAQYTLGALFIKDFFLEVPFITYFLGVCCIAGAITLVLWQTFNSKKILTLAHYFPFWASISTLIIFIGALPLIIARMYAGLSANLFYTTLFLVHVLGHSATIIGILKAKNED